MKKRRKKVNPVQQQKLNHARHKNEFLQRLRNMCCLLGEPQVYKTFSPRLLDIIYNMRSQSVRVFPVPGNQVHESIIQTARNVFSKVLRYKKFPVLPDNSIEISLYDFTTVYETLMLMMQTEISRTDPKLQPAVIAMKRYTDCYEKLYNDAIHYLMITFSILNLYPSDLRQKIYLHSHRDENKLDGKSAMVSICDIRSTSPERKNFIIDGISRPAFRVGWGVYLPEVAFDFIFLTPEQLQLNMITKGYPMPVFIQSHAIQRLLERLDDVLIGVVYMNLYQSLKFNLSVHRDKNGTIRLAMNIHGHKVGYLIADIIDRCVVLRTFLFLTQFGTPEGDKLKEMTGFNKIDCNYFEITKLSTFLESDIPKNEKLKSLFIEAGCESLFNIDYLSISKNEGFKERSCADHIIAYLGLNQEEEFTGNNEEEEEEENV